MASIATWSMPDLRRLYTTNELCPDGKPSGVFVKLVLVADKPFIRYAHAWAVSCVKRMMSPG